MKNFLNAVRCNKLMTALAAFLFIAVILSAAANIFVANNKITATIQHFQAMDSLPDGQGQKVKVILLNGQSNASGVGSVQYLQEKSSSEDFARYETGYDNILINFFSENGNYSSSGHFVKAKVGQGCTPDYIGPELGLADTLSQTYNDELVFILKYTWGGSNLHTQWRAPSMTGATGELYIAFINFTSTCMDYLRLKNYDAEINTMCWMQGESDAYLPYANEYEEGLKNFLEDLRSDLNQYISEDGLHFIDAGIYDSPLVDQYQLINNAKQNVTALSPKNHYFDTIEEGLEYDQEPLGNPVLAHFDSISALRLGHLFANIIVDVLS
jgi:hypothetical protein